MVSSIARQQVYSFSKMNFLRLLNVTVGYFNLMCVSNAVAANLTVGYFNLMGVSDAVAAIGRALTGRRESGRKLGPILEFFLLLQAKITKQGIGCRSRLGIGWSLVFVSQKRKSESRLPGSAVLAMA